MHKNRKIKNYIILPRFQLTIVGLNLAIMTISFGLILYQIHMSFTELYTIGEKVGLKSGSAFFKLLQNQQAAISEKVFIAIAISYIFSFWLTIIVSHRVAGPIYRLREFFKSMAKEGYSRKLSFRKNDYYHDLAEYVNDGLDNFKKQNSN